MIGKSGKAGLGGVGWLALISALALSGCGYHMAGTVSTLPQNIKTIAIPAWGNISAQYKLSDYLAEAVSRELISRTHYKVVADPASADATLTGTVANLFSGATVLDPITNRATGAQIIIILQVRVVDRSGRILFDRPNLEFRDRYEISIDPQQYFDESQPALRRLSRDVARTVVSAILESF